MQNNYAVDVLDKKLNKKTIEKSRNNNNFTKLMNKQTEMDCAAKNNKLVGKRLCKIILLLNVDARLRCW